MDPNRLEATGGPIAGLVDLLLPRRCAGCGVAGTGWCDECAAEIGGLRRVRRPLLDTGPPVYALGRYRAAARRAVLAYKEGGRRDLVVPLGERIADGLRVLAVEHGGAITTGRTCHLVPAPSRRSAARRRGGSHMARIGAHAAGVRSGAGSDTRSADCLALRRGVRDSVGLNPGERLRNLAGHLVLRTDEILPPRSLVVVIDDVLTTGATAAGCVRLLDEAGHHVAAVLVLTATSPPAGR